MLTAFMINYNIMSQVVPKRLNMKILGMLKIYVAMQTIAVFASN